MHTTPNTRYSILYLISITFSPKSSLIKYKQSPNSCGVIHSPFMYTTHPILQSNYHRYVKLDRHPLTDAISVDEVLVEMRLKWKYALVI